MELKISRGKVILNIYECNAKKELNNINENNVTRKN